MRQANSQYVMYVCLRRLSMYVCMSEAAERVCMYVCLKHAYTHCRLSCNKENGKYSEDSKNQLFAPDRKIARAQ